LLRDGSWGIRYRCNFGAAGKMTISWRPALSGIIPSMPPASLLMPAPVNCIFTAESLKQYRLLSAPYIVRANYDNVQVLLDKYMDERFDNWYAEYLQWVKDNL
jgi:hypothetical protein